MKKRRAKAPSRAATRRRQRREFGEMYETYRHRDGSVYIVNKKTGRLRYAPWLEALLRAGRWW